MISFVTGNTLVCENYLEKNCNILSITQYVNDFEILFHLICMALYGPGTSPW